MGADMWVVMHRQPVSVPDSGSVAEREEAYREVIDRSPDSVIAEALVMDLGFEVDKFAVGVSDFEFNYRGGVRSAVEAFATNPAAVALGRRRLGETARMFAADPWCRVRSDFQVGGQWISVYGGLSWGDEPFEGYGAVCALASLPELDVDGVGAAEVGCQGAVVTSAQVRAWSQVELTDEELGRVVAALPGSAVPGAVATVVSSVLCGGS